jgi:hypothetical protein
MRLRGLSAATACGFLLLVVGLLLVKTQGAAQSSPGVGLGPNAGTSLAVVPVTATRVRDQFVYSVPFLSGTVLTPAGSVSATSVLAAGPLVSGAYLTTIRVHNPDDQASVTFTVRAVETTPRLLSRGRLSPAPPSMLRPDDALEVGSNDLIQLLGYVPASSLVVIRSRAPLEVVAIYSAADGG